MTTWHFFFKYQLHDGGWRSLIITVIVFLNRDNYARKVKNNVPAF